MTTVAPASLTTRTLTDSVAVVMPAYREADNLEATVEDFLGTLQAAGHEHCVVVVDDGSPDATGEILDRLAERFPGRVVAVHHEVNRGYGAAVRSGIRAALDRTDMRRILLTDSDGQFKAADLLTFLQVQREERADGVIGYRRQRADSPLRKINGHLWTLASWLLLHTRSRDVDCAYKLLDRRLIEEVELVGEAAAIDPELLAKIGANHARIIERPVHHYPRRHGDQTGASYRVILRSLVSLARVYRDLVRDGHRWTRLRRVWHSVDPVLAVVTLAAVAISIGAFVYRLSQGTVLAYPDAMSHLMIARRIVDSPTAGAAQLGGVWPPLPHALTLPLVWYDGFYYTGFAAAVVSMVAFVVTVRYLYRIATHMAASKVAGVAAAGLFAANVNVLYLQSTPMTEVLLFACIAGAVSHLQQWCHTGRYGQLAMASVATMLATLTRYEGWVLCLAVTIVVGYAAPHRSCRHLGRHRRLESHLIFFGVVAWGGIAAWLGWDAVIFHDPLYWQAGDYAKPSLWVSAADKTVGALDVSSHTYLIAMMDDIGVVSLVLAAVGLLVYMYRRGLRASATAPYVLVVFLPFFIYTVYMGQRPLHVPEIHGEFYNVRFGLVMVLATAVFAGYLVSLVPRRLPRAGIAKVALAGGVVVTAAGVPSTVTLTDPVNYLASPSGQTTQGAAAWLRHHYDGGRLLMQNFGNEVTVFNSHVPMGNIVYEGSFRKWEPALADPAPRKVRWIYMRSLQGSQDKVWQALYATPQLAHDYTLVYSDAHQQIYRRGGTP